MTSEQYDKNNNKALKKKRHIILNMSKIKLEI